MSSFKRKLARQHAEHTKAEGEAGQGHEQEQSFLHGATPRPNLKLTPRAQSASLDRGRVLRRKSAGR